MMMLFTDHNQSVYMAGSYIKLNYDAVCGSQSASPCGTVRSCREFHKLNDAVYGSQSVSMAGCNSAEYFIK